MPLKHILLTLTLFSIAMGYLESAVVVYLRAIYYPGGFAFPLKILSPRLFLVELLREAATLMMLSAVAFLAGKKFPQRLAWFIFCFGVWDMVYYAGLKLLLGWPESLLAWDILFLIPVVWAAPVLAPLICSLTMLLLAGCILYAEEKGRAVKIKTAEWLLLSSGCTIILFTFLWDYTALLIKNNLLDDLQSQRSVEIIASYIPSAYPWWLFGAGELLLLAAIALLYKRINA